MLWLAAAAVNTLVRTMKADITAPVIQDTDLWMTIKDAKVLLIEEYC